MRSRRTGLAVVGPQSEANWRTALVAGTHRDEARFPDVHAGGRPLVGRRGRLVFQVTDSGNVEIPRPVALEQLIFTNLSTVYVHRFEPLSLVGIGIHGYLEMVIIVVWDFDLRITGCRIQS